MIIEFADPGYNFGFIGFAILAFVVGIVLFLLPFWVTDDVNKIGMRPMVGMVVFIVVPALIIGLSANDYQKRVLLEKVEGLYDLGFREGSLEGDRFTAATEDGQFFSGILVDLEPDSGYAYQVLEITPTK